MITNLKESKTGLIHIQAMMDGIKLDHYTATVEEANEVFDKLVKTNKCDSVEITRNYTYTSELDGQQYGTWIRLKYWNSRF